MDWSNLLTTERFSENGNRFSKMTQKKNTVLKSIIEEILHVLMMIIKQLLEVLLLEDYKIKHKSFH